ncbi:MAG TPA: hypothetical protein DEO87_06585, partial [Lachnospiraceae bacterium]|nr:hypothetical protein [Lachnospiraceae bacterium]
MTSLKPVINENLFDNICAKCGRPMPKSAPKCAFCGAENNVVFTGVKRIKSTESAGINYIALLQKTGANMILITDRYNLRYFSGFRGGEGIAVITAAGRYLIVDSRYTESAKEDVSNKNSGFTVIEFNNDNPKFKILDEIILGIDGNINIVFEDKSLTVAEYREMSREIAEAFKKYFSEYEEKLRSSLMNWIPAGDILERERRIKTPEEIELLRQAEAIGDAAFSDILKILKPGMTELEVAAEIEYSLKKHGAEGLSFDTIAASGINSSKPHAIPGRKKLENG